MASDAELERLVFGINGKMEAGQQAEAAQSANKASVFYPHYHNFYVQAGTALLSQPRIAAHADRLRRCWRQFDRAAVTGPRNPYAFGNRAVVRVHLGDPAGAVEDLALAIALRPAESSFHQNLSRALSQLGQHDVAQRSAKRAAVLDPSREAALTAIANRCKALGQTEAAARLFRRALICDPASDDARVSYGMYLLQLGAFARGWRHFEARKTRFPENFDPALTGRYEWHRDISLQGKRILVHWEQGLGDSIQFCRYVPWLAKRGADVVLKIQKPLVPLMRRLPGVSEIVAAGEATGEVHHFVYMMSLPVEFRADFDTIPSREGYLSAAPDRLDKWRARLREAGHRRWVGIAWSGSALHLQDAKRNVALSDLLACLPADTGAVTLQTEIRPEDRAALSGSDRLLDVSAEIGDFDDTAALCALVDRVVTVDTSVAHLAGALGRPTLVLVPFDPDWRWLTERRTSPWYASLRLIRQPEPGAWPAAFRELRSVLVDSEPADNGLAGAATGADRSKARI